MRLSSENWPAGSTISRGTLTSKASSHILNLHFFFPSEERKWAINRIVVHTCGLSELEVGDITVIFKILPITNALR
jgi:hypothetical protein